MSFVIPLPRYREISIPHSNTRVQADREIVEKNLSLMTISEEGGMPLLFLGESIGGNADEYKGFSCSGFNFYFEPRTGEIKYFGTKPHVPDNVVRDYTHGVYRVATGLQGPYVGISLLSVDLPEELVPDETDVSDKPVINLISSAQEYNRLYGFELEDAVETDQTDR